MLEKSTLLSARSLRALAKWNTGKFTNDLILREEDIFIYSINSFDGQEVVKGVSEVNVPSCLRWQKKEEEN